MSSNINANGPPLHNVSHVPFNKATDIPLDKAELLSTLLESFLYGFSLLMFGGTIWVLVTRRSTAQVNRTMLTAACALLLFSTAHLVIDVIRIVQGLILFRDTHPRGPIGYFSDASQWTFVSKSYVYTAQTLIGDGVILYRCYAVWQSKLVVIFPTLLWCGVAATGIVNPFKASETGQADVFGGCLWEWITSFYTSTFMANSLTTLLLAFRIWSVDRKITRLYGQQKSQLRSISRIIIDAGMIYSFTLLAALICFVNKSNSQYVILNMVTPIISITFYMVIIRVGLSHRAAHPTSASVSHYTSTSENSHRNQREMQIHVMTTTESKVDFGRPLSTGHIGLGDGRAESATRPAVDSLRSHTQARFTSRTL